jgi:hypothetical protein
MVPAMSEPARRLSIMSSEQHSNSMRAGASDGAVLLTSDDDDDVVALSVARATLPVPSTVRQGDGPRWSLHGAGAAVPAGKLVLAFVPWMRRASAS